MSHTFQKGKTAEQLDNSPFQIQKTAHPLADAKNLNPLMERIGNARVVMIGEASHGTHEFYTWRARISQRLIKENGFHFIAIEGDWPDWYTINRYIKHYSTNINAVEVLKNIDRRPSETHPIRISRFHGPYR